MSDRSMTVYGVSLAALLFCAGCVSSTIISYTDSQGITRDSKAGSAYNEGTKEMDADQYDSAITNLTKALTIDPTYFDAYVNRGLVFAILGQYDQAIADENKAIELAPNDANGYGSLALILVSCPSEQYQDNAKALQLALKAVSLSPDDYESLDSLACAYAANGDFKNAIATGQQAITLCPDGEKRDVYQQQIAGFEQGKNIWQQ